MVTTTKQEKKRKRDEFDESIPAKDFSSSAHGIGPSSRKKMKKTVENDVVETVSRLPKPIENERKSKPQRGQRGERKILVTKVDFSNQPGPPTLQMHLLLHSCLLSLLGRPLQFVRQGKLILASESRKTSGGCPTKSMVRRSRQSDLRRVRTPDRSRALQFLPLPVRCSLRSGCESLHRHPRASRLEPLADKRTLRQRPPNK